MAEKFSLLKISEKKFWKFQIFDLMCIPQKFFDNFSGIYGFEYTYKEQISEEQMNFWGCMGRLKSHHDKNLEENRR